MSEIKLTPKQKKWLEASKKVGRVAITKSERETLERLYAEMLPAEQVELKEYIEKTFGNKKDSADGEVEEPTIQMEKVVWSDPSEGLKRTLSTNQKPRWLKVESD